MLESAQMHKSFEKYEIFGRTFIVITIPVAEVTRSHRNLCKICVIRERSDEGSGICGESQK